MVNTYETLTLRRKLKLQLPPVLDGPRPYVEHGSEGEFINAESIFNYRILLHLSNGTTIEQVAGQAGFTPRPKPKSQQSQSVEETQHGLLNTRRPTEGREDRWDPAPACVSPCLLGALLCSTAPKCCLQYGGSRLIYHRIAASWPGSMYRSPHSLSL
jgi:hypothetical protein